MPNWTDENGVSHFNCQVPGCCKPWGWKPDPEATFTARVSKATFEALQLDNPGNVAGVGLDTATIRWLKTGGAVITATRAQLIHFADFLDPYSLSEEWPRSYMRAIARDRERLLALKVGP